MTFYCRSNAKSLKYSCIDNQGFNDIDETAIYWGDVTNAMNATRRELIEAKYFPTARSYIMAMYKENN